MVESIKPIGITKDYIAKVKAKNLHEVSTATGLSEEYLKEIVKAEKPMKQSYKLAGVNFIGIGHNMDADPEYKTALKNHTKITITDEKMYTTFAQDLLKKEATLDTMTNFKYSSLKQKGRKEALLDVTYNVKPTTLETSPLISKVKNGQLDEAVKNFTFITAGGKVLPGLCTRRINNIYDYAKETYPDAKQKKLIIETINTIVIKSGNRKDVKQAAAEAIKNLNTDWENIKKQSAKPKVTQQKKEGFWSKVKNWFHNLFN